MEGCHVRGALCRLNSREQAYSGWFFWIGRSFSALMNQTVSMLFHPKYFKYKKKLPHNCGSFFSLIQGFIMYFEFFVPISYM